MLVLQPCPQGVQPAVIVPRITFALDSIVIIEEMAVRVEQSFDFQYLLQLIQRPAILVMLSRVAAVLFRQYIDIIDELPIAADIGAWVYGRFQPTLPIWKENPAVSESMWSPNRFALPYPSKSWKVVVPESSMRALTLLEMRYCPCMP